MSHHNEMTTTLAQVIKILDNRMLNKKRKRSQYIKYISLGKYQEDYYSSDDDNDNDNDNDNDSTITINPNQIQLNLLDLTELVKKIGNLDEMIRICKLPLNQFQPCNREDLMRLKRITPHLEELNQLIGMTDLKTKIMSTALFYSQDLHKIQPLNGEDEGRLLHCVIQGPPGSGKTTVAKIIGRIYLKLGILKSDKFIEAKRKDLIGEYLGQTAPKTTKVLDSALGGVLFIDETYAMGNKDKKDIFSKEFADTLNQYLTEHKKELAVFVAGYADDLIESFFSGNQGLLRRFPNVFEIDTYSSTELRQIFIKKVKDAGWRFASQNDIQVIPVDFMKTHEKLFEFAGGDVETFFNKCQEVHAKNTFGLPIEKKGVLTNEDILAGLEIHKNMKTRQKLKEPIDPHPARETYNFYT